VYAVMSTGVYKEEKYYPVMGLRPSHAMRLILNAYILLHAEVLSYFTMERYTKNYVSMSFEAA